MKTDYTDFFLLKYLYKETSLTATLEIEHSIEYNESVQDRFQKLKKGIRQFPKVLFAPKSDSIDRILEYSSRTSAINASV